MFAISEALYVQIIGRGHGGIDRTALSHHQHGREFLHALVQAQDQDQRQRTANCRQIDGEDAAQTATAVD